MASIEQFRTLVPGVGQEIDPVVATHRKMELLVPLLRDMIAVSEPEIKVAERSLGSSSFWYQAVAPKTPYGEGVNPDFAYVDVRDETKDEPSLRAIDFTIISRVTRGRWAEEMRSTERLTVDRRLGKSVFDIDIQVEDYRNAQIVRGLVPSICAQYEVGDSTWRFSRYEPAKANRDVDYDVSMSNGDSMVLKSKNVEIVHDDENYVPAADDLVVLSNTHNEFWNTLQEIETKALEVPPSQVTERQGLLLVYKAAKHMERSKLTMPSKERTAVEDIVAYAQSTSRIRERYPVFRTSVPEDVSALNDLGIDPFEFRD